MTARPTCVSERCRSGFRSLSAPASELEDYSLAMDRSSTGHERPSWITKDQPGATEIRGDQEGSNPLAPGEGEYRVNQLELRRNPAVDGPGFQARCLRPLGHLSWSAPPHWPALCIARMIAPQLTRSSVPRRGSPLLVAIGPRTPQLVYPTRRIAFARRSAPSSWGLQGKTSRCRSVPPTNT